MYAELLHNLFSVNKAAVAGAVSVENIGTLYLHNNNFALNEARNYTGALNVARVNVSKITNNQFFGNKAISMGAVEID